MKDGLVAANSRVCEYYCSIFTRTICQKLFTILYGEKGENLATKEDVKEITRRTEEVQQEFRQEMARFSNDLQV